MRKITKAICVALSLMLLVNLAGIEAAASEPAAANQTEGSGEVNDAAPDKTDGADENDEPDDGAPEDEKQDDGQSEDGNDAAQDDGSDSTDVPAGDEGTSSEDVDLDAQLPEQGDAADDEKSIDTQNITEVKAEPVAGKNELKIIWNAASGAKYKIETFKENSSSGAAERSKTGITAGTETIEVTPGTQYTIKVTNEDDNSDTAEIPAILLATESNGL